jgi:hypothetical protein
MVGGHGLGRQMPLARHSAATGATHATRAAAAASGRSSAISYIAERGRSQVGGVFSAAPHSFLAPQPAATPRCSAGTQYAGTQRHHAQAEGRRAPACSQARTRSHAACSQPRRATHVRAGGARAAAAAEPRSRPRFLAIAGRLNSIPQTHLTVVMGPLCLATPSPPEVASTDPRPHH